MASRTGYVSSYDADLGFGYIRPADDPKSIVLFRESALPEKAAGVAPGQQVTFELARSTKSARTPVARRVVVNMEPADGSGGSAAFETEAL